MRRRCQCGTTFKPRASGHVNCKACSAAHRAGRRCKLASCATCARAFARLDAFNARREPDNTCPCGCGVNYGAFKVGESFGDARRDFIAVPEDKDGKRRHGRRNQVLGLMRMRKRQAWKAMCDEHVAAKGAS